MIRNLKFGGSVTKVAGHGVEGWGSRGGLFSLGSPPIRIRLKMLVRANGNVRYVLGTNEDSENQDFGRDINKLDYFRVGAFDVYGDDHLNGVDRYGGGGTRDRGIVVGLRTEPERGSGGIFANDGNNGCEVVGETMEQERSSSNIAGTGGRDMTREVPVGIFSTSGKLVGQGLKQYAVPVAVAAVVVVVMMMVVMTKGRVCVGDGED